MEKIMNAQAYAKANDPSKNFYASQKKTLEINARHPIIKELKNRVEKDKEDATAKDLAVVLFETATLRSGYSVPDLAGFAGRIERMLKLGLNIDVNAQPEEYPEDEKDEEEADTTEEVKAEDETKETPSDGKKDDSSEDKVEGEKSSDKKHEEL